MVAAVEAGDRLQAMKSKQIKTIAIRGESMGPRRATCGFLRSLDAASVPAQGSSGLALGKLWVAVIEDSSVLPRGLGKVVGEVIVGHPLPRMRSDIGAGRRAAAAGNGLVRYTPPGSVTDWPEELRLIIRSAIRAGYSESTYQ
jgi:hypothetical protein